MHDRFADPDFEARVAAAKGRREGRGPSVEQLVDSLTERSIRSQVDAEMRRFRKHQLAASLVTVLYVYYRWQERA